MRLLLLLLSAAFAAFVTKNPWWGPLPFLLLPPFWFFLNKALREMLRKSLSAFWLVTIAQLAPLLIIKPVLSQDGAAIPLGLSFFVFQAISFTADWRKKKILEFPSLADYWLYLLFFPKFLCGPIERFAKFNLEARKAAFFPRAHLPRALELIALGLAKKFLLANYLRSLTAPWFDRPGPPASLLEALAVVYAFAIEFYCDFSAYTDLARGAALLFGVELGENFNRPYLSRSVQDFWQRWHMSLSAWFRDYVHFPLFFAVKSLTLTVFVTFFLMGIWHGLGANYLALGAYWGVVMALYSAVQPWRVRLKNAFEKTNWWIPFCIIVTCHFVIASFFLLRADSPEAFRKLSLTEPWRLTPYVEQGALRILFSLPLLFCVEMVRHRAGGFFALSWPKKIGLLALLAYYSLILFTFTEERGLTDVRFLYFQF